MDEKLFQLIQKCKDLTLIIGLAKLLSVNMLTDQKDEQDHYILRDFEDIILDIIDNFNKQSRPIRKDILKVFRESMRGT